MFAVYLKYAHFNISFIFIIFLSTDTVETRQLLLDEVINFYLAYHLLWNA